HCGRGDVVATEPRPARRRLGARPQVEPTQALADALEHLGLRRGLLRDAIELVGLLRHLRRDAIELLRLRVDLLDDVAERALRPLVGGAPPAASAGRAAAATRAP